MKKIKNIAEICEALGQVLKLASIIGIVLGAIIVVVYSHSVGFYPVGLTVGDGLFFLWVIITFGFYYIILTLVLFGAAIGLLTIFRVPINWILGKIVSVSLPRVPDQAGAKFPVIVGGIVCNAILLMVLAVDIEKGFYIYISVFFMGYLYLLIQPIPAEEVVPRERETFSINIVFTLFIVMSPLIFGKVLDSSIKNTMSKMGIYEPEVILLVEKDTGLAINEILRSESIKDAHMATCNEKVCSISNVEVLYDGIGKITFVKVGGEEGIKIKLDSSKISVVIPEPNKKIQSTQKMRD
ncbi:hypothetical protein P8629_10680 [Hydrogenovibrio sp. 3SP14C1]|uniref:hypothetical protein n=1 Tax=Hydrogenovibrio sp. 3SP14C1 TaxID=3038774 RepID=UPI0024166915|nr:hypothetical protein [Hydrogenovibrio sp. 3SP14C1]MDG4813472.1 hypothetical protein [Hydrogenovibrio sp. 3SP14C1]